MVSIQNQEIKDSVGVKMKLKLNVRMRDLPRLGCTPLLHESENEYSNVIAVMTEYLWRQCSREGLPKLGCTPLTT